MTTQPFAAFLAATVILFAGCASPAERGPFEESKGELVARLFQAQLAFLDGGFIELELSVAEVMVPGRGSGATFILEAQPIRENGSPLPFPPYTWFLDDDLRVVARYGPCFRSDLTCGTHEEMDWAPWGRPAPFGVGWPSLDSNGTIFDLAGQIAHPFATVSASNQNVTVRLEAIDDVFGWASGTYVYDRGDLVPRAAPDFTRLSLNVTSMEPVAASIDPPSSPNGGSKPRLDEWFRGARADNFGRGFTEMEVIGEVLDQSGIPGACLVDYAVYFAPESEPTLGDVVPGDRRVGSGKVAAFDGSTGLVVAYEIVRDALGRLSVQTDVIGSFEPGRPCAAFLESIIPPLTLRQAIDQSEALELTRGRLTGVLFSAGPYLYANGWLPASGWASVQVQYSPPSDTDAYQFSYVTAYGGANGRLLALVGLPGEVASFNAAQAR